ncbi:MAG: hypothetical protein ACJAXT_000943 [Paracoccaceae bacterium]|jgi:hypothetical protein
MIFYNEYARKLQIFDPTRREGRCCHNVTFDHFDLANPHNKLGSDHKSIIYKKESREKGTFK